MATPRPSVSKEVFLEAALSIVDEFGADAVTTRTLGNAVGLDSTTVYRYFGSKDVLLGSLFDHVIGKAIATCAAAEGTPQEKIRAYVASYRSVFVQHPNVSRLNSYVADMLTAVQGQASNSARISSMVVEALHDMGLSGRRLVLGYQMVETFVVGALLLDAGAHARSMSVRTLRLRAIESESIDSIDLDETFVSELSDEAFWMGVESVIAALEALASSS